MAPRAGLGKYDEWGHIHYNESLWEFNGGHIYYKLKPIYRSSQCSRGIEAHMLNKVWHYISRSG